MAKEKKLTIKHLYGKDLSKISPNTKNLFPVYVIVTYDRRTTKFKSPSLVYFDIFSFNRDSDPSTLKLLNDSIQYDIQLTINNDIRIINTLKRIFDNFSHQNEEFDILFFNNHRTEKLLIPIEDHCCEILRRLVTIFFSDLGFEESSDFISIINDSNIPWFLESMKEINVEIYSNLMKNDNVFFYSHLIKAVRHQKPRDYKFTFLIDIYDSTLLKSLSDSLIPYYKDLNSKEMEALIFNKSENQIESIMKS